MRIETRGTIYNVVMKQWQGGEAGQYVDISGDLLEDIAAAAAYDRPADAWRCDDLDGIRDRLTQWETEDPGNRHTDIITEI